jgi:hypothetical protein
MTTSNKCQGTIHTCKVDHEAAVKDLQARLDQLKRKWYDWTAKYSGGAKTAEEYGQAYTELADMTEELGEISKVANMSGVFQNGGAIVAAQADILGNSMASQYNILLTRNLPVDTPGVSEARRDNALRAWGMMKGAGMVGGARGMVSGSRVQMLRDIGRSLRKQTPAPPPVSAPGSVAIKAKPVSVASSSGREAKPMKIERKIERGEKVDDLVNEAKSRTFQTGNEHAVVTLANGERALVSGGPGGINFEAGSISRIFGHTHPTNAMPSAADAEALRSLGQSKQYVFHGGQVSVVRSGH